MAWTSLSAARSRLQLHSWLNVPNFLRGIVSLAKSGSVWISDRFVQAAIDIGSHSIAWGQYLDVGSKQSGMYGTAAGVFVLSHEDRYHILREGAIENLLHRFESRGVEARDKYQFQLMPKIASFLNAFTVADLMEYPRVLHACEVLVHELAHAQLFKSGWGYYYSSEQVRDPKPSIASTSLILLAVDSLGISQLLPNWNDAIEWLTGEISAKYKRIFPGELALGLLALRLGLAGKDDHSLPMNVLGAHNWLIKQARSNPAAWQEYFLSYETITEVSGFEEANDEYFVIPSPMAIIKYFLLYAPLVFVSPGIFEYVLAFLGDVEKNKCYISPFNGRVSSRMNQWAAELAKLIDVEINHSFIMFVIYRYYSGLKAIVFNRIVFIILITVGIAFGLELSPFGINGWFSLIVVSLIVNVLANLISEHI